MNEVLNKKLAEWAGLSGVKYDAPCPKFTESLDACFKWLVPKLIGDYQYTLAMTTDVDDESRESTYTFDLSSDPLVIDAESTDKTPALALCLAIEKLIDEEKGIIIPLAELKEVKR